MNVILFDDPQARLNLLPFTFTRPVAAIRVGILTLAEKWERYLGEPVTFSTQPYLQNQYPLLPGTDNLWINASVCPDATVAGLFAKLKTGEGYVYDKTIIAYKTDEDEIPEVVGESVYPCPVAIAYVDRPWKIFQYNGAQIRADFELLTKGRHSAAILDEHTRVYKSNNIFLEGGAVVKAAILNAENGPIYLGKNSQVSEGAIIRGPFALCEGSHVNMGAKVRGDVTVGPFSKIGGEVSASVIFGYANKAHDGFLGCSVIGEWCNLGADTNTSNLKNNYENVKVWSYASHGFIDSGSQFVGLMMGDHSKCAVNTMFNTGTVVGVSANIFGEGFPRTFIPSFTWGGAAGFATYQLPKALGTAERVLARRNMELSSHERDILAHVFETTARERVWEK